MEIYPLVGIVLGFDNLHLCSLKGFFTPPSIKLFKNNSYNQNELRERDRSHRPPLL